MKRKHRQCSSSAIKLAKLNFERKVRKTIFIIMLMLIPVLASAQTRDKKLTVHATTETGEELEGQLVSVLHTAYQISYGTQRLDATGRLSLKVYEGEHLITIQRPGYEDATKTVMVNTDTEVTLNLVEKVRSPYALKTQHSHDAFTGNNTINLAWNEEAPVFADDFESYEPFSINFSPWTGIDNDHETAAALIGDYPNRGAMQYAQIINPLTVEPTWWYEYEVLRPRSGKQYVGFTRTMSGNANDDWLISPVLTIGTENVLSFRAKAADKYPERFQVYATTVIDNPQPSDFKMISEGNYESVDYTYWHEMTYNLAEYAGKQMRFAIHYIGEYNRFGNFMLMVDDVFVGQRNDITQSNPNEKFVIYLDGAEIGETYNYNYAIENVPAGHHVIGIKAKYVAAETDIVTTEVDIDGSNYVNVTLKAVAESILQPKDLQLTILNKLTAESIICKTDNDCKIVIPSLPKGEYIITNEEGAYEAISQNVSINGDDEIEINLTDNKITPFNITVSENSEEGSTIARWNQKLSFTDSFEDYEDFATGEFGGWTSLDLDQMPVYPIGLGNAQTIVSFPGSGTASNPLPVAPIVFNPNTTKPAMLPTDKAMKAPTGDKQIIFFSPQRGKADKWLISPEIEIHDNYTIEFTAKAYSMYPESMEICVNTKDADTKNFKVIAVIDELEEGEWVRYKADLKDYAGQNIRIALHYTSYDAFFAQVDDITIGNENGTAETVDFGNVINFEISLDGKPYAVVEEPFVELSNLTTGSHTIGVKAIYKSGASEEAFYTFNATTGINTVTLGSRSDDIYNIMGQKITHKNAMPGIYIRNGKKLLVK